MLSVSAQALVLGGALSALAAVAHLACIALGAPAYRFMGAGERMARSVEAGKARPTLVTMAIATLLLVWASYAFSGAGLLAAPADVASLAPHRLDRPSEQNHIYLGGQGLTALSEDRHALSVLMSILGGGMSSRLFQTIREDRGLAYSVYSFAAGYADAGLMGMAAACQPHKTLEVAGLMLAELERLTDGASDEELRRAKGQLAGGSALALEESDTRMARLGRAELTLGEFLDIDATLERIDRVTDADVRQLAAELAGSSRSIAAVGQVPHGLELLVSSAATDTVDAAAPAAR